MSRVVKNNFGNFLVVFLIFSLVGGWFYSGWPNIWQNPPIPPKVQEARAAISLVGQTSANTNIVGLPSGTVAGDLGIIVAGRTNAGGPQTITGWTDLGVVGGGTGQGAHGQRLLWKLLDATDISNNQITAGSQTTEIQLLVLRGASGVNSTNHGGTFADTTTVSLPARTIGSGSWVVGMATHRTQTGTTLTDATVADYTTCSTGATSALVWCGTGSASASARTITVTSGPNVGRTMEVEEAPSITCTTPLDGQTNDFGTIDNTAIFSAVTSSTTVSSGSTIYMKIYGQGSGSNPGLWKSPDLIESPTAANPSNATDTLAINADGYGITATTTGANLVIAPRYNNASSTNIVGGLATSTYAQVVASSSVAVTNEIVWIDYKASVNISTPAGAYQDTVTITCSATP